jgi:hypothetical protein
MLRRFGLRSKVLAGYGIALLLIALVFVWAIHNLLRLGQASDAILSENYQSILATFSSTSRTWAGSKGFGK